MNQSSRVANTPRALHTADLHAALLRPHELPAVRSVGGEVEEGGGIGRGGTGSGSTRAAPRGTRALYLLESYISMKIRNHVLLINIPLDTVMVTSAVNLLL